MIKPTKSQDPRIVDLVKALARQAARADHVASQARSSSAPAARDAAANEALAIAEGNADLSTYVVHAPPIEPTIELPQPLRS